MKKYIVSLAIPMAVLSLVIAFFVPAQNTQAQTVNCPAGYTCTPIPPQPIGCPVGYMCTPINSASPLSTPPNTQMACYTIPSNLYIGSTGSSVSALQTWLIENGFDIRNISLGLTAKGYYGTQTAGAVAKYLASAKYQICNRSVNTPNQNPTNQSGPAINNCPTNFTWNGASCVSNSQQNQPLPQVKQTTYLNMVSPNGGEFITPGSQYTIKWSTDSTYPMGIEIKRFDPNSTVANIMNLTLNGSNGSYVWNVPTNDSNYPTGSKYKAAVYELAPTAAFQSNREADSNDYFYIGNKTITPTVQAVSGTMPLQYSADGSYAYQDFYFTVQAGNMPIYVSKTPSLVVHLNSNIQGTAAAITAQNPAFVDGDASGAWIIPAGNQRTFKVTINMSDNTIGLIKMSNGGVGADQFYYSLSPNITSTTGENSVSVSVHTNW